MTDYVVDRPMALDTFLRKKDFQAWRIEVLVECGAIKLFSEGAERPLKRGIKTHVDVDDIVRIPRPLPDHCQKAMKKRVDTDFRDYAWIPGTSKFDKLMATTLEHRPNTIRIKEASITTLVQFVKMLENSTLVTHPVRHLVLGSHANNEGQLKLPLTGGTGKFIDWEDLEAVIKSKSLKLDDEWFQPRPHEKNQQAPTAYHLLIRGCRIGTERVYLRKLREALGGRIVISAPKHFDGVAKQNVRPKGFVEYLAYSFSTNSPTPLKTKDAVVKALLATPGLKLIDNSPIPEKKWRDWVPSNPEVKFEQEELTSVMSPVTGKKAMVKRVFRFEERQWLDHDEPLAMDRSKKSDADRLKVLKPLLAKRPEMQSTHPYPMYVRLGYKSFDEFIAGWTWRFLPKDKAADEVKFNAVRHQYTVIQPITEVKTGELLLNFYPEKKKDKVIENLKLDDDRLFATVSTINP